MTDYLNYFKKIGFMQTIGLLINFIFYKLKYLNIENKRGWFLVKRKWVWIAFAPAMLSLFLVFKIIEGVIQYVKEINNFTYHWIDRENKPMTLKEKIIYRRNLNH